MLGFSCKVIEYFVIGKKKTSIYTLLLLLFGTGANAQGLSARFLGYIERYKDVAMEHCRSHGVPASITLAQGLLESNAGQSYLAVRGNNHFGIKCHKWAGEVVEYDDTLKHDCYRSYGSPEDSFLDHSRFLCGKRYQPLHALDTADYKGWAEGLRTYGYAEDPAYPQKLIGIIERYSLHLYDSIAMVPPVKQVEKSVDKQGNKHKSKTRNEVPVPHKKAKPEATAVPPPQRAVRDADKQRKQESQRDNKRRTTIEVEKKAIEKKKEKPHVETVAAVKPPAEKQLPPASRRQHNQRNATAGKPLTGHADNDD